MGKLTLNGFITPNGYVDEIMEYLTGDEFKVLVFAVRHLMGWGESITDHPVKHMSLTMFTDGYTSQKGYKFGGCGLTRGTVAKILKTLTTHKLLTLEKEDNRVGNLYSLNDSPDWNKLQQRKTERANASRNRSTNGRLASTEKARQKRENAGLSDRPLLVYGVDHQRSIAQTQLNTEKQTPNKQSVSPKSGETARVSEKPEMTAQDVANPPTPTITLDQLATNDLDAVDSELALGGMVDKVQTPKVREALDKQAQAAADKKARIAQAKADKQVWDDDFNRMQDAVLAVFELGGAEGTLYAQMIRGEGKKGDYKEFSIKGGQVWAVDLLAWAAWWKAKNPGIHIVKQAKSVNGSIEAWLALGKPKAGQKTGNGNQPKTPAQPSEFGLMFGKGNPS